ncbi:MAG: amidohydrolase [Bryobacterales bacterium]|nr:amidohydrolase [Bryobacterales bacterium]
MLRLSAADLIIHNAKVLTVDDKFTVHQAIAVKGNRIEAVGANTAILKLSEKNAKIIDAKGRTVVPGLIDSHVHVMSAGLSEFRAPLPKFDSFETVRTWLKQQAAKIPAGQWIIVPRTFPTRLKEMSMPTKELLDVITTHPVGFDASYVWVFNSYALKQNGITRETKNPPGGEIGRDKNGEPNGILRNANGLIKNLPRNTESNSFTAADKQKAIEDQLNRYVQAGLTAIGDRAVTPEDIALYPKVKLPLRVVLTWRIDAQRDTPRVLEQIRTGVSLGNADPQWLKFGAFKVTLDGGMTIGTAYQRVPYGEFGRQLYGQTNPDSRGQLFIPPDKLYNIMETARDKGWTLTAHSQGGGAIDALLECFEKLNARKPIAETRSHLMHASFQSPEAIERLAKLGLPADVQPAWLQLDGPALSKVFPNGGMRNFIPLGAYRKLGVRLAGGSDHMVGHDKNTATNPYNPFLGMWTSVTRKMTDGKVLHPENRVSREDALRMYTIWGAYLQHADKDRGSIEKGKLADLVILDRDYMTVAEDQIKDLAPLLVMIDGNIVVTKL